MFLHHISRDGDPHLHVHVAVWNRVQRADGADEKWRTLDSRSLHNQRLAVAPVTDRVTETRLTGLGYVMVPRLDGNGSKVGGVSQQVMDLFSSRSRALTPELKQMIQQYTDKHGKPPSKRTIWLLGQQAAQNTLGHSLTAAQMRPLVITAWILFSLVMIALWLWMARATGRGRNWARILSTVLFGLATLQLISDFQGAVSSGTAESLLGLLGAALTWPVGAVVVWLLWRPASSAFFRPPRLPRLA